jgi:group I intron endonuclease
VNIVYLVTNTIDGKQYVGMTSKRLAARWRAHRYEGKRPERKNLLLHQALKLHGESVFTREVLYRCEERERACRLEMEEIAKRGTLHPGGYNLSPGDGLPGPVERRRNGMRGRTHSPETKQKIGAKSRGRALTEEHRRKVGDHFRGKKLTAEHRAKVAASKLGPNNPMWQRDFSATHREKLSAAGRNRKMTDAQRAALSARMRATPTFAILTPDRVREIRAARLAGEMGKTLAQRYGVSPQTISLVCNGTRWGHIL